MNRVVLSCVLLLCLTGLRPASAFDRQDTLRGSNGPGRSWWDVRHYDLNLRFEPDTKWVSGWNTMAFSITGQPRDSMQIDLQDGMFLDDVVWNGTTLPSVKDGNVFWVTVPAGKWAIGSTQRLELKYHGRPQEAVHPPWDGGFIWAKDSTGHPWYAVACQGFGASSWWPCKDYQGDEPDSGMQLTFEVLKEGNRIPVVVSNGRTNFALDPNDLYHKANFTYTYQVKNPINTYNATFYIGDYVSWTDTFMGEKGRLDLSFHPLRINEAKARKHFAVVKDMLRCFEYWLGPYPFYEDGYKLVEAPFLGMEHQSAVAYGNLYKMGYLGHDRSGTGVGLKFDFIIVHESGHEWFGNNITARDIADNWLHEGLTTYTEALFAEWILDKEAAFRYTRGQWKNIRNDRPVIGAYGVNDDGSGDKYDKGSAVIHMVRMMIGDDRKFRDLLRGMNRDFYHKIITTAEAEAYIRKYVDHDLKPFFDQYLRTTNIPKLEWRRDGKTLYYRFTNVVPGFELRLPVASGSRHKTLKVTTAWQTEKLGRSAPRFSPDFLINVKEVGATGI